jgi:glycosyltransferase involved in cell wall biosynthesis
MVDPTLRGRMLYLVGGAGNAERVDVSDLFVKRLTAYGLHVDYVIFSRTPDAAWRKIHWHGATAYSVGRSRRRGIVGAVFNKMIEFAADLRTCWLAMTGPYDVVQIRDKFVVAVLCLWAARLRGIRFVYWLSYPYAENRIANAQEGQTFLPWFSLSAAKFSAWLLYRMVLPGADHVFVQSAQMLRDVASQGIPPAKMTAVQMAVDESLLEKRAPVVANTVLYLGTLIKFRRLDVLIDALGLVKNNHPDARLIFVGDGEHAEDRQLLEDRAVQLGLSNSVEFTGMLPMPDAHDRAASAAVCISPFYPTPILQSTSPTKLYEYMALGRPVVANRHPEQSAVIASSGAGVCVEWSARAFADGISELFSNPVRAELMGERGRAYARAHCVYPVIAREVAEQYNRLLRPAASDGRPGAG